MNARDAALEIISESGMGVRQLNRICGSIDAILYHDTTACG